MARASGRLLVVSMFLAAAAGLVYELVAGTLSSYLLGDSVTQFSLVIGVFLSAMGAGSWLSRYVERDLEAWFVGIEALAGLVGGLTGLGAFAAFAFTELYEPVIFALVAVSGALVGFEVPLVVRIMNQSESLRDALSEVLAADYVGALAASLAFPFVLLPSLGLVRAGILMGGLNVAVAGATLKVFATEIGPKRHRLARLVGVTGLVLALAFGGAGWLVRRMEDQLYQDEIVFASDTGHQRMVVTRWREDVRLFLDGHLQFSSVDEYRYHEALVHPAMLAADRRARVLVLGGGDGLAVREVLRYPEVGRVDLVDLDPAVTGLFASRPMLVRLNGGALKDPRVVVSNTDALKFLEARTETWDVIVIDLPDPSSAALGKLYSRPFYTLVARHLAAGGRMVTQAGSPFLARQAFWCIVHTIQAASLPGDPAAHLETLPLQAVVPTFGTWGFVLAGATRAKVERVRPAFPTRFLTPETFAGMLNFPPDMAEVETPVSELDDPAVTRLYVDGYHRYLE